MKNRFLLKTLTFILSTLLPYQETSKLEHWFIRPTSIAQLKSDKRVTTSKPLELEEQEFSLPDGLEHKIKEFWYETYPWWIPLDDPKVNGKIGDYWYSVEESIKRKGGDCEDYAEFSAVKLSRLCFPATFILLDYEIEYTNEDNTKKTEEICHIVHLLNYRNRLYGASGILPDINRIIPKYSSIEDLLPNLLPQPTENSIVIKAIYKIFDMDAEKLKTGKDNKYELVKEEIEKQNWKPIPLG